MKPPPQKRRAGAAVRNKLVALAIVACLCAALASCAPGVSGKELSDRAAKARPAWQSYEEDIKAQMGAGPAAEWNGSLTRVEMDQSSIRATFRIEQPWASRDIPFPILMRQPKGGISQNKEGRREDGFFIYLFDRPEDMRGEPPAWLEFRFPHGQRRIVLNANGGWIETTP
jgi:hypothetical protein